MRDYLLLTLSIYLVCSEEEAFKNACDICNCSVPTMVDCSSRDLKQIPLHLDNQTTVLNMSSNKIQRIDNGRLNDLPDLIVLDLCNNSLQIQHISNSTFRGLSRLKVLNISLNDQFPLTNITTPLQLFENLPSLEVLSMYGTTGTDNCEYGYPDGQLKELKLLRELWMDGRQKMTFGPGFRNLTSLKVLCLAGDHIVPSWRSSEYCMTNIHNGMLDNLVTLTHLYIRKCEVEKVDDDAFQALENLEYLDLSLNSRLTLTALTQPFLSLRNKTDTLVLNGIEALKPREYTVIFTKSIAQSLSHIPLRQLHLDNNRIELIDQDVFNILPKTLQVISLKNNQFYQGFYVFFTRYMENLTHLDMSYQFFKNDWAVLHRAGTSDIADGDGPSVEYDKLNFARNQRVSVINVTNNNSKYVSETEFDIDGRSENNGEDEYEINGNENYNIDIMMNMKRHEIKNTLSRRDILQYVDPLFTCPQIGKDNYIPPGTIIGYLPPKLEHLDISVSNLANPVFTIILSKNNSLKLLNASQSLLYCWQGPVAGLDNLEILDLSGNYCYNMSVNFFSFVSSLKNLYLQDNFLGSIFGNDRACEILKPLSSLEVINIAYNRIQKIPTNFFLSQNHLVKLYAYGNVMEIFEVKIGHMKRLRHLDLSLNYINSFSVSTRRELESISSNIKNATKENSLNVYLNRNPIHCNCDNIDFLSWILKHSSQTNGLNIQISECLYHRNSSRLNINSVGHLERMVHKLEEECKSYLALYIGLAVCLMLIINIGLGIFVHKQRWKIQYWYYVVLSNYNFRIKAARSSYEEIGDGYKYDVFVASAPEDATERNGRSTNDKDFVMDKLRPVLKASDLIAFVQVYHIQGNNNLIQTIGRAINSSRVVLFVFSKDWNNDAGMKTAVHMWQCDVLNRSCRSSILGIRLAEMTGKDADMIKDLYCSKIIDYPNESNIRDEETFWRECTSQIQNICRKNNSSTNSQL